MRAAKRHSGSHESHQKTSKQKNQQASSTKKMFQLLSNPPGALSPSPPSAAASNPKLQIRIIITRIPDLFPNRLLRR
jgi:hypothetical protein